MRRDETESIPTSCEGCGACCLAESSPPFMPNELDVLPAELRRDAETATRRESPPGSGCSWLDRATLKCLHYEHRPEVCRQFDLAGAECLAVRRSYVKLTTAGQPVQAPGANDTAKTGG